MAQHAKRDLVRCLSNRIFMTISGRWFRSYSIVNHVGRTSRRRYRNRVSAFPLGDGYVIAVLYGLESQWVRNVMADDSFTLPTKGGDHVLERPQIIGPGQALPDFPWLARRNARSRGIQHFVWAHSAEPAAEPRAPEA